MIMSRVESKREKTNEKNHFFFFCGCCLLLLLLLLPLLLLFSMFECIGCSVKRGLTTTTTEAKAEKVFNWKESGMKVR